MMYFPSNCGVWVLPEARWAEPSEHFEFAGSVMIHIIVHAEASATSEVLFIGA